MNGFAKPAPPFPLWFFDEHSEAVPKPWIIKGVIARGETSSWFGPPKTGKSALLTDLCVAVAAGDDWRGYRSKSKCGVLYLAFERADLVKRRFAAYRKRGHSASPIAVAGKLLDLMDPRCIDTILAIIEATEAHFGCEVGLLVIDTYSKGIAAGGGDEDKARDQNKVLANLRRLHERKSLHIATVGHTGKDEARGERGSNARLGDIDLSVRITRSGDLNTAEVVGANDQPEGPLVAFKIEIVTTRVDEDGDAETVAILAAETFAARPAARADAAIPQGRRALEDAINEALIGAPSIVPVAGMPAVRAATVGAVQKEFFRRYVVADQGDPEKIADAKRKAFKRALDRLPARYGRGACEGKDWIWLAQERES